MAENTENNGQNLDQVAEMEVAPPQVETTEVSQEETQEGPQSGAETADSSAETMDLDKLESKLSEKTGEQTAEEPKEEGVKEAPKAEGESEKPLLNNQDKPSRSENRYQQLANENRELKQQLQNAQRQSMGQLAGEAGIPIPPWEKDKTNGKSPIPALNVQPGTELTPEQYQEHVAQAARQMADAQIAAHELQMQDQAQRQQQVVQLDESMNYIKQTYPELNPENSSYSVELDETVGQLVESLGQVNPAVIKQRVDQIMALRGQAVQDGAERANSTMARQMSEQAVIPGSPVQEIATDLNEVDLDKLESQLGVVS